MIIDTEKLWTIITDHFTEETRKADIMPNCSNEQVIKQIAYLDSQLEKDEQVIREGFDPIFQVVQKKKGIS